MVRIGILGGTFDPPHLGHVRLAMAGLESGTFDRLLVIPAERSPLKDASPGLHGALRADLLRRTFARVPEISVDDLELLRPPPSYTIETLERLQSRHPDAHFTLLIGADAFGDLPRWHRLPELLERADFLVADRPHAPTGPPPELADRVRWRKLAMEPLDISATDLRARMRMGRSLLGWVPEPVANALYLRAQASAAPPGP